MSALVSSGFPPFRALRHHAQVLLEAKMEGALLPPYHPAVRAVERVGRRIAAVATDGFGGGFQGHLEDLQWEFAVIR